MYTALMGKRIIALSPKKKTSSHSHKTKKRLAIKEEMLAAKASGRKKTMS
ncbi:MAG: hypothetical protein ACI9VM_000780 [Candidatus Azotimanducaceae bacterium]|jgi:hypothetical protein